jgi:hypothetical protein
LIVDYENSRGNKDGYKIFGLNNGKDGVAIYRHREAREEL